MESDEASALPIIDLLWNYTDPAGTEAKFVALLPQARASGNAEYLAQLLAQVARAQGLQLRFDAAHATLDEADAITGPDISAMKVARVRGLLERGRLHNSANAPELSITPFKEALDLAEAARIEVLAVDAAHMLGIATRGDDSIAWNRRGLEMAQAAQDPRARAWRAALANNLAWTYYDLGRHEDALDAFRVSLAVEAERNNAFRAGIAQWSIGKTLRAMGRTDEALALQQEVLTRPERKDNAAEGYSHEEIGECLLFLGREAEAKPHFARAWELLHNDVWLQRDEPQRVDRLQQLGTA